MMTVRKDHPVTDNTDRPYDGWQEEFLANAVADLSRENRKRLVREWAAVEAELAECPQHPLPRLTDTSADDPEPAVRRSPWARGEQLRCDDHEGHIQSTLRMRAKAAQDVGDPLWKSWHALAERAHLYEALRGLGIYDE
jgi:hypothetical protein